MNFTKCYWCGKETKNLEINENGKILKTCPCKYCNIERKYVIKEEDKEIWPNNKELPKD